MIENKTRPLIPISPEGLDDIAESLLQSSPPATDTEDKHSYAVISNPREYIQIPQCNLAIALRETHKGKNFYDTLENLTSARLVMPSPAQFMRHWINVKETVIDKRGALHYADGSLVGKDVAEDLWKYMSSAHQGGCWTWLNASFKKDTSGKMYMENRLVVSGTGNNRKLQGTRVNLDNYVPEDAFVDLTFNAQGLPSKKSANQNYVAGSNIKFYYPRENAVAGFVAYSDRAYLDCDRDLTGTNSGLGVFACAEGAPAQK